MLNKDTSQKIIGSPGKWVEKGTLIPERVWEQARFGRFREVTGWYPESGQQVAGLLALCLRGKSPVSEKEGGQNEAGPES